jgi:hypothetical protein
MKIVIDFQKKMNQESFLKILIIINVIMNFLNQFQICLKMMKSWMKKPRKYIKFKKNKMAENIRINLWFFAMKIIKIV